jgi:amino acid adenylation domain-containing protein
MAKVFGSSPCDVVNGLARGYRFHSDPGKDDVGAGDTHNPYFHTDDVRHHGGGGKMRVLTSGDGTRPPASGPMSPMSVALQKFDNLPAGPWSAATLAALVLASARRHADRTALFTDGCAVRYRELVANAAGIADAIQKGVVTSVPLRCAILGNRSLTAFAGILGSLLARATYVPLNPRHPRDHLTAVLAASEADVLIIDERSANRGRELLDCSPRRLFVLLPDAAVVPSWAAALPQHRILCRSDLEPRNPDGLPSASPEDGAYLLFTSGSTGAPKGVLVRHRNVMAYLRNVAERYAPQPGDRFTQLFDLTFDLSVHDMFLCWGAGAALYCPPESARIAPREFVRRHDLTFWFSVPSTAALMSRLHMLRRGDLPSLRWSLFCGEVLPRRLAESWAAAAPYAIIENLYGPTESTIAITAYRLPSQPVELARLPEIVPIGVPLPGQSAIIIAEDGAPVRTGDDGELCLAGSQVTDGYWRQPDLTAERFAPISTANTTTWYRTGDRARISPGYGLLFRGRMDRQVKIAGHRVELQEVETVLRHASGSDTAAAIAWPVGADGLARGIVAFVPDEAAATDAVCDACRRTLPPYMVPSRVHRISDWPINRNGKTDYDALRQMIK